VGDKLKTLWLDSENTVKKKDLTVLEKIGFRITSVQSLEDLKRLIIESDIAILKISNDVSLLKEIRQLMTIMKKELVIFCRLDTNSINLSLDLKKHGCTNVILSDDFSKGTWQSAYDQLNKVKNEFEFIFNDPKSIKLLELAKKVGQSGVSTLITGPSGSGKEVLAEVLHKSSSRKNERFVALNCAAIPENLIEDMLFGHEKGAFTGAGKGHKGLFEQANGGTLFLDEIGDMPIQLQSKLLRVIQEKKMSRLGSQEIMDLDVRIVAATNKNIRAAIINKEFREDLYYRISAFQLRILPLNQRKEDIIPLSNFMLKKYSERIDLSITNDGFKHLTDYSWPGNVRELENVIQRALVLCDDSLLEPEHLLLDNDDFFEIDFDMEQKNNSSAVNLPSNNSMEVNESENYDVESKLNDYVKDTELKAIEDAIKLSSTRVEAAKKLGISPRTLRYKIAKFKESGLEVAL
jgi:two-component system response regulator FlrC